jgi:hypothetical protein
MVGVSDPGFFLQEETTRKKAMEINRTVGLTAIISIFLFPKIEIFK